jgi:hypothetical protein
MRIERETKVESQSSGMSTLRCYSLDYIILFFRTCFTPPLVDFPHSLD